MDDFKEKMYIGPMIYFGTYPMPFTGTLPESLKSFQNMSYPSLVKGKNMVPRMIPQIGGFPEDIEIELKPDNP